METQKIYAIPLAILCAGVLIAAGIFILRSGRPELADAVTPGAVRPVAVSDHIVGDPTAPIIFITYSDLDCDYCKSYHETLTQIMSEYGPSGKVAWVWRHFPVPSLSENSYAHAQAAECVYELKGNSAFFSFIDALQSESARIENFAASDYERFFPVLGVATDEWKHCITKGLGNERIEADINNGLSLGIDSTPFTVIQVKGKEPSTLSGALPYDSTKKLIEETLSRLTEEGN